MSTVVGTAVDFIGNLTSTNPKTILWCRSFGGHLCARVPERLNLQALVLDGGIQDMFQSVFCSLPTQLQGLYVSNRTLFDRIMSEQVPIDVSLLNMLRWSKLGFNVDTLGDLLDAFQPFFLSNDQLVALSKTALYVNDPQLDDMVGMQSHLLWKSLGAEVNPTSRLVQPPISSGCALHCCVGSTRSNSNSIISWIQSVVARIE